MNVKVLILTPLPLEYDAVVKHLTGARNATIQDAAAYEMGTFIGKHHRYSVAVREPGMKNVDMALATEKAIQYFKPQIVLLIGIAGGVKDVRIGDVVIASSAFNYESGKETGEGFLARPAEYLFSEELLANAQVVSRNPNWKKRTSDGAADSKVLIGPIAAGDKVVAGIDNPTFERIKQNLSHIKALEMESAGFGRTVQSHRKLHALVIRGISDLCVGKAETDQQNWQPVAAERAAAVGFELLDGLDFAPFSAVDAENDGKSELVNWKEQLKEKTNTFDIKIPQAVLSNWNYLLKKGRWEDVIDLLTEYCEDEAPQVSIYALQLASRKNAYKSEYHNGLLSFRESDSLKNKITFDLLFFIDSLK